MILKTPPELFRLLEQIREIDQSAIKGGTSSQFLETRRSVDGDEVRINGNPAGLIHFARSVLEVVAHAQEGSHHHFDAAESLDHCEVPIVVTLKGAEWDIPSIAPRAG